MTMTCVSVAVLYSRFLINVIEDKYEGKSTDTGNSPKTETQHPTFFPKYEFSQKFA
jgi:hypothetical protein